MTTPMTPDTPEGRPYPAGGHYPAGGTYPAGGHYPPGQPGYPPPQRIRPRVDAGQLWAGGAATAIVAGLIALVGVLVCRWLFNIPILAPRRDGAYGDAHTTTLVLVSAGAALVATLLAHLLLASTPRPTVFFGWIVGLVTVVLVVFPFRTGAVLSEKVATAVLYLLIGFAIGSLISGVGDRATRLRPVPERPAAPDYQGQNRQGANYPGRDY